MWNPGERGAPRWEKRQSVGGAPHSPDNPISIRLFEVFRERW